LHSGPESRETVRKSYEYALTHCGYDKDARILWDEYILFLKDASAATTFEEQQKNDLLRKAYHRAVQIPLRDVEEVWSELEAFEMSLNKTLAKKFMSDLMPAYMQARQVYRNLRTLTPPLYPPVTTSTVIPGLFLPTTPTYTPADRTLVNAWKAYLKWEESNPLELEDKDKAALITRIQGMYRKAFVRTRFFPEIWYMAYEWHRSVGKEADADAILKSGLEANPTSFVLNFVHAEALEQKGSLPEVHDLYMAFLTKLEVELEEVEARTASADSSIAPDPNVTVNESSASLAPNQSQISSQGSQSSQVVVEDKKTKELTDRKAEYGVVWIRYMRFARRASGALAGRDVFKKARQSKWLPWEVFDAAGKSSIL
jgi:cleavage stimulation factor subunit 3